MIARSSVAMSETVKGKYRAFGLAGKLYPTDKANDSRKLKTANFFLVDDLGGTLAEHYTDVGMSNEPAVSKTSAVFKNLMYVLKLARAFGAADSNPNVRQVYEISELGEKNIGQVLTPRWMKMGAVKGQTLNMEDFRDELTLKNRGSDLIFNISVADSENSEGVRNWKKIGQVTFTESTVSDSCDHRLHFHHPRWKEDLNHN